MAWRYTKYPKSIISKKVNALGRLKRRNALCPHKRTNVSMDKRAEDILKLIRERANHVDIWHGFPERIPAEPRPCSADDWQTFKKNFVDTYGGEKVQATGMTHSEFWDYFQTGNREGETRAERNLKQLLGEIHADKS